MDVFASIELQFDDLLQRICNKLQLNATQRNDAEQKYISVAKWLSSDVSFLSSANPDIYPQGSLRIGTTVKPIGRNEFDLDLICELKIDREKLTPKHIMAIVEKRLSENSNYKSRMDRSKCRCIRLNYENEFHLDIVPAAPNVYATDGSIKIPDRELNAWIDTNPKGYAKWFESRYEAYNRMIKEARITPLPIDSTGTTKAPLQYVVQLLKRNRDLYFEKKDEEITPKSIVLTTISGNYYAGEASIFSALDTVTNQIAKAISKPERLIVKNPTNNNEDYTKNWENKPLTYVAFKTWFADFELGWKTLKLGKTLAQKAAVLKNLFGESITNDVIKEQTEYINQARMSGKLSVGAATGILSTTSNPDKSKNVDVKTNTFYGE